MSHERPRTFRYRGEDRPITDDVALTAVGILDQYDGDVSGIEIRGRDEFLVRFDGKRATLSAIELIGLAHTHHREPWNDAIESLEVAATGTE